jgi:dTDP-4-amino-4,6-dideoxygalactose transaminase
MLSARAVHPSHRDFRFPLIRPAVPEPEKWLPLLQRSYEYRWFSNFGPVAGQLEAELAEQFGEPGDEFVLTSSATAGLAACLIAQDITGPVLAPAFTFAATVSAIRMAGAVPVLVDVDPATWACDAEKLELALRKTGARAAILVAPFGITQDFTRHVAHCAAQGSAVIVDNAAGLGGGPRQRRQTRGDACEVYSLHATKPLAVGEGGAIQTDQARAPGLRSAINFGLPWQAGAPPKWGINGKMPEVSAAIGLAALASYRDALSVRRAQAGRYVELLDRFDRIAMPRETADAPWQSFPCSLPDAAAADGFQEATARRGLQIGRYYRPSLADWGDTATLDGCPHARDLAQRMVCLPVYPTVGGGEIEEIHEIVRASLTETLSRASAMGSRSSPAVGPAIRRLDPCV